MARKKSTILLIVTTLAIGATAQVDLHSHAVTEGYLAFVKTHHAEMDEGFPIPQWDVASHLAFMDKAGIEPSVLTMPAPQPWFGDVCPLVELTAGCNGQSGQENTSAAKRTNNP